MRFILIFVSALAALYGGYWFVGAGAATTAMTRSLDRIGADGLDVGYTQITTVGFPSRFDTTVEGLRLADPVRGWAWDAPFLQVFALSYRPNRVIVVWPDRQTFDLAGRRLTLGSESLRASASASPTPALPLREATLDGRALTLASAAGWEVDVAAILLALRSVGGGEIPPDSYEVYAEATEIALPGQLLQALGGAEVVPAMAERLRVDGRATLDGPLDRTAPGAAPHLTAFTLRDLTFRWGDVTVSAAGSVTIDSTGQPEGQISLSVENWQRLIDMARATGALSQGQADVIARAGAALADGGGRLVAPLRFQNGFTALGPLPIGPAPRLR